MERQVTGFHQDAERHWVADAVPRETTCSSAPRHDSREEQLFGGACDRQQRRVSQLSIQGNDIEALADRRHAPEQANAIKPTHLPLNGGPNGKDPGSMLTEDVEKAGIRELASDARTYLFSLKPLLQGAPERGVLGRKQKRRPVQRLRKVAPVSGSKLRRGKETDPAVADQMTERSNSHTGTRRDIGNHHVYRVNRKLRQQLLGTALLTADSNRLLEAQRGFDDAIGDQLRNAVCDADGQCLRASRRMPLERVLKLAS